jgi:hypothetical protein
LGSRGGGEQLHAQARVFGGVPRAGTDWRERGGHRAESARQNVVPRLMS